MIIPVNVHQDRQNIIKINFPPSLPINAHIEAGVSVPEFSRLRA
jgi:hypothetical protein